MKKTLIALAVLAASGASFAQSTVTLSGTYGGALQSYTLSNVKEKGFAVTDSSLKIAAVEDLGGGLKASFGMQFTMGNQRGMSSADGLVKEDSSIALSGDFGTVTLANTRTSDTGINGMVFSSWLPRVSWYDTVSARAASDVIAYASPAFNGFSVGLSQAEIGIDTSGNLKNADGVKTNGSTASTTGFKTTTASVNYVNGPVAVMFAQKSTNLSAALVTAGAKKSNMELAATYDFGVAKVGVAYDSATTTSNDDLVGYSFNVPVGAFALGFNTAARGNDKFTEYGVNYSLSKRTTVALQAGKMSGTTSNGGTSTIGTQYRAGVKHAF